MHHADERPSSRWSQRRVYGLKCERLRLLRVAKVAETVRRLASQFETIEVRNPVGIVLDASPFKLLLCPVKHLPTATRVAEIRQRASLHRKEHRVDRRGRLSDRNGLSRSGQMHCLVEI